MKPKVDFFIVGVPKAGTTSLYFYLNEHPQIEMSSEKEPDFFSYKDIQKQDLYYKKSRIDTFKKYNALYSEKKNLVRGEASVSYLYYNGVPKKIFEYNTKSKIIIMIRNPVERAFSHYLMDKRLGYITESFETIINKQSSDKKSNLFYQQYIELGKYTEQIKRYFDVFRSENILFIDYDDFVNRTSHEIDKVYSFLNLDNSTSSHVTKIYNSYTKPNNKIISFLYSFGFLRSLVNYSFSSLIKEKIQRLFFIHSDKPALIKESRNLLINYFTKDINDLSKLLNKDYTKWIK